MFISGWDYLKVATGFTGLSDFLVFQIPNLLFAFGLAFLAGFITQDVLTKEASLAKPFF